MTLTRVLLSEYGLTDIFELINAEDELRDKVLKGFTAQQVEDIAAACNRYPVLNVEYDMVASNNRDGKAVLVKQHAEAAMNDDDEDSKAPSFTVSAGSAFTLIVRLERVTSVRFVLEVIFWLRKTELSRARG